MIQRALKWLPAWVRDRIAHRPGLLKILDNISWLFFDKILRMGVGLLVGVWVARYLGAGAVRHPKNGLIWVRKGQCATVSLITSPEL